jgi:pyruvate-formate lyase
MRYRGMSENDDYSVNSCMGNVIVGKELADMWGCCVNMNLPLELAVNEGKPLKGKLPESLRSFIENVEVKKPDSIDEIKSMYADYIKGITRYVAHQNLLKASWIALNRPNPFLSIFLDDCIEFGRDRAHSAVHVLSNGAKDLNPDSSFDFDKIKMGRGAKYHNVTVLSMGFAHAADSLSVIDELVFKSKKYTLEEIKNAAIDNYSKSDKAVEISNEMRKCPKYADGNDTADEAAAFVLNALADAAESCYTGNMRYLPTCHTIDANVQFGNCVYASMDSRKDGEPFGKNAGAVVQVIKTTPTDLIMSASKLPQFRFSGGVPIDIYVTKNILESDENRAKFRGLLRTYFKLGGMQVQVNSVNIELLKQAYENPKDHPNVIVRKGGFSIYFTDMLKEVQKDMIERFEKEINP